MFKALARSPATCGSGRLAERLGLDMDQAFALLREHARNTNQRLTDVARYIIDSATADFPPPGEVAADPARSS